MNEFDIIEELFVPLTMGQDGCAGLKDDGAVLSVPDGYELAITSDTLNEGVHFLVGEKPENIAAKALAVNVSDIASMGAKPLCYQLNLALPLSCDYNWLKRFANSLFVEQQRYGMYCSGGDTTYMQSDCLSISITAFGVVPRGRAVRRMGAQQGDYIVITGVVGDAYLGFRAISEGWDLDAYTASIVKYLRPSPRFDIYEYTQEYVRAATDISDGLLADCAHIAKASGLCAHIDIDKITYSDEACLALRNDMAVAQGLLSGGDDYELILSVGADDIDTLMARLSDTGLSPQIIGCFKKGEGNLAVTGRDSAQIMNKRLGWVHF